MDIKFCLYSSFLNFQANYADKIIFQNLQQQNKIILDININFVQIFDTNRIILRDKEKNINYVNKPPLTH